MLFRRGRSTSLIAETHEFIVNDHVALTGSYRFMGVYVCVCIYTYLCIYVCIYILFIADNYLHERRYPHLFVRASTLPLSASPENSASGTMGRRDRDRVDENFNY